MVKFKAGCFVIWALISGFTSVSQTEIIGNWAVTKGHFCILYIKANIDVKPYRAVGVIAHMPPPPKIAEMLAHYAELHLQV